MASGDGNSRLFSGTDHRLAEGVRGATLLTPNVPELARLVGRELSSRDAAIAAASELSTRGPAVLLKTGHLPHADTLVDVLAVRGEARELAPLPAVSEDVRGTGCQLSSAIVCGLASNLPMLEAVEAARRYLNDRLFVAVRLGKGRAIVVRPQ